MKRLSGLAFAEIAVCMRVRAPGMSLVLASHEPFLVLRRCMENMTSAANEHICVVISRWSCNRPNVLTLSCKNRPPCGAHRGVVAAATGRASEGAKCGRRDAVQFGAAQGGSAAGPTVRRFLSACEGS